MRSKESLLGSFKWVVAAGILYYLFRHVPLWRVMGVIDSADLNYVTAAVLISLLSQVFSGYRTKLVADSQGIRLSVFQVLEINLVAIFYGLFLPGGTIAGGVIRFYRLSERGDKLIEAFALIALDRMAGTGTLCLVGLVFWLLNSPSDSRLIGLSMLAVLGGLVFLHLLLSYGRVPSLASGFMKRARGPFALLKERLASSLERYRSLSWVSLVPIISAALIYQLLGALLYYLLAVSLNVNVPFATIGWIRSVVGLVTLIPISVSGLGVREGTILFLLKAYGVPGEKALALSFLSFAVSVLLIGLLGGLLEGRKLLRQPVPEVLKP